MPSAAICTTCGTPLKASSTAVGGGAVASTKNTLSITSMAFSGVSLLFLPPVFGLVALILAIIAMTKKEKSRVIALVLSIALPIVGMVVGALVAVSMNS